MPEPLIQRNCPVCESTSAGARELFCKQSLRLVRCKGCGMVYANPVAAEMVNGEYYDQLANPFYLSPDKLESDYAPVRFARELKLFRRFCPRGKVLDVGCSTGAFLYQLRAQFGADYQTTGMDVSGPAVAHAEKMGTHVRREPFLSAEFGPERFDAITFWAVMEHLANPGAFLHRAAMLLAPGGICCMLVPNFQSLAVRLAGRKYRYIFPQHLNYFAPETLRRFVENETAMRVVYETTTHFNPVVIVQDLRSDGQFVADDERARLLKRTTAYKQNPLLKPAKLALGMVEKTLRALKLADNLVIVLQKTGS